MIGNRITHRTADGVRIPGTWRHAFIRNGGRYFLTDLFIYADGLIDCWELVTVEEFEEKLGSGWVATDFPEGAEASAHDLASWTFGEPDSWLTPELLLAEVRDTIDQLNGRPDSTGRCLAAVDVFLADRTEENRAAARAAFLAVPESRRRYALGDMDRKDQPLRVLLAGPGGQSYHSFDHPITQEDYDEAVAYFEERARWIAERPSRVPADGPVASHAPAVKLYQSFPNKPAADPGKLGLRNDYPAPITVGEVDYPSVARAYLALSLARPELRAAIAAAETPSAARTLAAGAARREGWTQARTAVLTGLLRAKYAQHPDLAEILLATDDATVLYDDMDSDFWGDNAGRGRNWSGRLLELVRAELHARRAEITER
ncbi:NADAR family protein [Kitasatospora sp. NBC_01287]|uniref:NADAR family protein n=1 Tax=Kitasatospora sp. NBC_01287 TaxID=2903573 RepID=UPI002258497D|nr:NADAR family protein [Kitasatospora sp. NBC_01287]MCX4749742.1 NADAR family protein [Kitasatospora sp. NBC_01287]